MNNNKKSMIHELFKTLQLKGKELQDEKMSLYEKASKLDVVLDTMKFLQDYDENVKVLNQYWNNKRKQEKFDKEKFDKEK